VVTVVMQLGPGQEAELARRPSFAGLFRLARSRGWLDRPRRRICLSHPARDPAPYPRRGSISPSGEP